MKRIVTLVVVSVLCAQFAWAARAKLDTVSKDPYVSAMVVDADTGEVLFEDNAEAVAYPASVLKLMVLLVVIDHLERGTLQLDEMVQVTPEAAKMGGSQVYLDPKERFSIEDLMYALMVQSANDAAVALAIHIGGSKDGFVAMMNERAQQLGMKDTHFSSVHGLPPSEGQKVDTTTARDLAVLSRELAANPETYRYTGTRERDFRNGEFVMRTHNHLLASVDGCDGFKTGYFKAAGFSIVATAKRKGVRIIAVVLGSKDRKVRDAKATELLAKGFGKVPPRPEAPAAVITAAQPQPKAEQAVQETVAVVEKSDLKPQAQEKAEDSKFFSGDIKTFLLGFVCGLVFAVLFAVYRARKRPRRHHRFS